MFQYMPTLLVGQYKIQPATVYWANTLAIVFYASTCLAWGWIGDRIGRGTAMVIGAVLTCAAAIGMFSNIGDVNSGAANLYMIWCYVGLGAGFIGLLHEHDGERLPDLGAADGVLLPVQPLGRLRRRVDAGHADLADPGVWAWRPAVPCRPGLCRVAAMGLVYRHMQHYLGAQSDEPVPAGVEVGQAGG